MNEQQRASKKQRELLSFIDGFIKGNGYGPSYREVMRALDYKSVSTVAVHVNGLITRGYLRKRDNSARSLEVVGLSPHQEVTVNSHEAWLKTEIEKRLADTSPEKRSDAQRLIEAARLLGFTHTAKMLTDQLEARDLPFSDKV
jgi:SOS-response transcriptional repressor LexA